MGHKPDTDPPHWRETVFVFIAVTALAFALWGGMGLVLMAAGR